MKMKQHLFSTVFALMITATAALAQRYDITLDSITFSKVGDDLHVLQGATDDTYVFNNGTFPNITVYGNSTVTENLILIDTPWTSSGYETIITLSNVLIQTTANAPITLIYQSSVRLFLAAGTSNELTTAAGYPGIKASDDTGIAKLRIKGSGKLVANGGESSAGIGGDFYADGGEIIIEDSVTVIATGGMGGAGIGGGEATGGGLITITSNATVVAKGGNGGENSFGDTLGGAAGIGGGGPSTYGDYIGGAGGTVMVSGHARVTAKAGEKAAGIGGGEAALFGGTLSIGPYTKVVAFSDGTRHAIDDDDADVAGNGYGLLLNFYQAKAAGTTNSVCLRSWSIVTNIVSPVAYKSLGISLCQTNIYRMLCNSKIQEHQANINFPVLTTGMTLFTDLADTNSLLYTLSTPVPVPYEWLAEQYPEEPETNYEFLANSVGANGVYVWESYVAGLVPTNATSTFTASITLTNQTPYISWSPNYPDRVYTVQGKGQLTDSSWGPTNSASRFFNVNVEKP